jgi:hypothetical protein
VVSLRRPIVAIICSRRHTRPVGRRKAPGEFGAGRVAEPDVRGAEVVGEVGAGAGARDEQDVRGEVQQPGANRCLPGASAWAALTSVAASTSLTHATVPAIMTKAGP